MSIATMVDGVWRNVDANDLPVEYAGYKKATINTYNPSKGVLYMGYYLGNFTGARSFIILDIKSVVVCKGTLTVNSPNLSCDVTYGTLPDFISKAATGQYISLAMHFINMVLNNANSITGEQIATLLHTINKFYNYTVYYK